jgi:SGNH hydrolase-like domain, acetyltransferase AlgX
MMTRMAALKQEVLRLGAWKVVIALGFMAFLVLPVLLMLAGQRNTTAIDNRPLARLPAVTLRSLVDARFYAEIKNALIDGLPFRPRVIRARGHVLETVLADFNNPRIVWGKDGWMFLRDAVRFSCDQPEIMGQAVRGMITFTQLAKELGRDVTFMIAPNKETIDADKLADRFQPYAQCETKHRALFHAMVRNNAEKVRYLDAFAPARAARNLWPHELFYWFDVHWDCHGTAILGNLILRDLTGDPERRIPVTFHKEKRVADISTVLGRPFTEEWTGCASPVRGVDVKRRDDGRDEYFQTYTSTAANPAQDKGGGKILLIHDSFANGLTRLLPQTVPGLTMYNVNNRDFTKLARAMLDADRIYVEIVERAAFANFTRLGHPNFTGPLKAALAAAKTSSPP